MGRAIRFGIVGCGLISAFHAGALAAVDGAALAGVSDVSPEAAGKAARRYDTRAYESYEAMLASPSVDAVCICTPSGLHAAQARAALRAGKHVLAEKPMALTLEDCDSLINLAGERRLTLSVVSQYRYSPEVARVKDALRGGLLGRLIHADLYMKFYRPQSYYNNGRWRGTFEMDGGGALMNQGIHGVDLMRFLLGTPRRLTAMGGTLARHIEVEDTVNALAEYPGGALGVIQAGTAAWPGSPRRIELNGENGRITLEEDRVKRWEVNRPGGLFPESPPPAAPVISGAGSPNAIDPAGHIRQLQNFVEAVNGGAALLSDGREGRATLETVLAVYESMRTGRAVVFPP